MNESLIVQIAWLPYSMRALVLTRRSRM